MTIVRESSTLIILYRYLDVAAYIGRNNIRGNKSQSGFYRSWERLRARVAEKRGMTISDRDFQPRKSEVHVRSFLANKDDIFDNKYLNGQNDFYVKTN